MRGIEAPISVVARYLGRTLNQMYYMARLEGAPSPTGRVGQVMVYSVDEWLAFAPPVTHGQDISFDG